MSEVRPDIDLGGLSRPERALPPPRRRWLRVIVPLAILLTFAVILASTMQQLWRGSIEVSVIRPSPLGEHDGDVRASGAPLLQAAGWVEPDPFPMQVTALAPGVVREVLVQESDVVHAGDVVVRLVDDDAKLALKTAEAVLAKAQADRATASLDVTLAREIFQHALAVTEAVEIARAEVAGRDAEKARRIAAVAKGEASVLVARQELELQRELESAGATGPRQIQIADARVKEAESAYEALEAEASAAEAASQAAAARLARAEAELVLRFEDRDRSGTADTRLAFADAALSEAFVAREIAKLRASRMEVRAMEDGVVLERLVAPGAVLETGTSGAPVCTLYDPTSLRVRVDIPQADIAKVSVDARAEISAETRSGKPYQGKVLRVVQKADIQKVTLQAHVRVLDGDLLLRPEMLCQVRFFAADDASAGVSTEAIGNEMVADRVLIPARLVVDGSAVWVVGALEPIAERRQIEIGSKRGDWIEVRSGLNLSDKLIDEGRDRVGAGSRVHVKEMK